MKRLELALSVLREEAWLPTPLLPAATIGDRLGVELWLKREDCTPVGSFKIRGALVAMSSLGHQITETGVYVASAGNYGLAIAFAGQRHNVKVTVAVPENATPSKMERIRMCGAELIQYGNDFDAAKGYARAIAAKAGAPFWEDGVIEEMAFGAATIAAELLTHTDRWDYVLVPVGNGSLMKGIASVFKEQSPHTTVAGLVSNGAPSMAYAIKGQPWDENASVNTIGDGLSVRVPIGSMVEELQSLVDEVWIVEESKLLPAVRTLIELEQVMVEPSAAVTVAGLEERQTELKGKRVAAIMTGAHLRPSLIPEVMSSDGLL